MLPISTGDDDHHGSSATEFASIIMVYGPVNELFKYLCTLYKTYYTTISVFIVRKLHVHVPSGIFFAMYLVTYAL